MKIKIGFLEMEINKDEINLIRQQYKEKKRDISEEEYVQQYLNNIASSLFAGDFYKAIFELLSGCILFICGVLLSAYALLCIPSYFDALKSSTATLIIYIVILLFLIAVALYGLFLINHPMKKCKKEQAE